MRVLAGLIAVGVFFLILMAIVYNSRARSIARFRTDQEAIKSPRV